MKKKTNHPILQYHNPSKKNRRHFFPQERENVAEKKSKKEPQKKTNFGAMKTGKPILDSDCKVARNNHTLAKGRWKP